MIVKECFINKFIELILFLLFITSSWDLVGITNIYGFNFRINQFFALILITIWIYNIIKDKCIILPYASIYMLCFIFLQILFTFHSPNLKNAVGYDLWLLFNFFLVCSIQHISLKYINIFFLIKIYLISYFFMSILGICQYLLYFCGINLAVSQTWPNNLPRINGFSYEPSYYATYMIIGFIVLAYYIYNKEYIFAKRKVLVLYLCPIIVSLVLCSSRMGYFIIGLFFIYLVLKKNKNNYINNIDILYRRVKTTVYFLLALSLVILVIISIPELHFLLIGLGIIDGNGAWSIVERLQGLLLCLRIFWDSPIYGYSLGGVDPIIAQYQSRIYSTLDNGAAMSTLGEILVAGGIFGTILYFLYFYKLIKVKGLEYPDVYKGLTTALLFEIIILFFNQNILRPYFWIHIAIVSAYISNSIMFRKKLIIKECRKEEKDGD